MSIHNQAGASLVELMISLVVGLMLLAGTIGIFVQGKHSFNQNDNLARMQEDARFALEELARDIGSAGFWGEMVDVVNIAQDASLAVVSDCGPGATPWVYDLSVPLAALDNATGDAANAAFGCIDADVFEANTDVIAVKRVAGATTAALEADSVYLKTNGIVGMLMRHPEAAPAAVDVPAPANHWTYVPAIYYIRNHAADNERGDGIPTLCRKYLDTSGVPDVAEECIARGIEDLQLEFGVDTDGDGRMDRYLADPTPAEMRQVASVKIMLLARSIEELSGYENDKTYSLSNRAAFSPADGFQRRVYSTTVLARNLMNQTRFGN